LLSLRDWIKPYAKLVWIIPAAAIIYGIFWKVPQWQVRAYHGKLDAGAISKLDPKDLIQLQKDLITAENNARLTLAQIIGGLVVLLGLYATFKNVRVAEEGKLTERFSKAVELLGSKELALQLGGIYALERIARDSQKDHWTVMEVLTAFVRERTRKTYEWAMENQQEYAAHLSEERTKPSAEVQAALTVIGRRKWTAEEKSHQRLDLNHTFLEGANLESAHLKNAFFDSAILNGANFNRANLDYAFLANAQLAESYLIRATFNKAFLSNTELVYSHLDRAELNGANLSGAHLSFATMTCASLIDALLSQATLNGTNLAGAVLKNAHLDTAKMLTWEQISPAYYDETTKLPPDLEELRKKEQAITTAQSPNAESDGENQPS